MSDFIKEYRVKNPQYSDLDDNQLVTALHGKYNSDKGANLSLDDFSKAIEYQPIQQEPIEQPDNQSLEVDAFTGAAEKVEPPYQGPVAKAWEPTLWEQIKSLGTSDSKKARAMNEFAARQIAKEQGIPVKQVYKSAGFLRPLVNPEGRAGVQAFTEGAEILAEQAPEIPQGVVNSVLRVIRGGDETVEDNWLDDAIKYTEPSKPENTDPNYEPFYGVGKSLGTSLTSITAAATATALAAETGPLAPVAGGLASATVAYRSSKDEFIERIKTILNKKSQEINGRPINQEEWDKALIEYDSAATKYGAWEAIPEALSNMVFLRALAAPMKGLGKKALEDISKRASKVMLSEQLTETVTGVGQSGAEAEAGIGEQKTVGEAFREQVVQTGIITGLMGGGAAGGKYVYETVEENLAPERVIAKEMEAQLRKVNPDLTEIELAEKFASPLAQEIYDIKKKAPEDKTVGEIVKEKIYDEGVKVKVEQKPEAVKEQIEVKPSEVITEEVTKDAAVDKKGVIDEGDQQVRGKAIDEDRQLLPEEQAGKRELAKEPLVSKPEDISVGVDTAKQPSALKKLPPFEATHTLPDGRKIMVFDDKAVDDFGVELGQGFIEKAKPIEMQKKSVKPKEKPVKKQEVTKPKDLSLFSSEIKQKNPSVKFSFSGLNDVVTLDKVVVSKEARETGVGTKAMNDIVSLADNQGKTIALTPSTDFGGTKKRLTEFYKRFGFVENKGKNKDFEISESMYREPKIEQKAPVSEQLKPKTEKTAPKVANMKVVTPPKNQEGVKVEVQKQEVSDTKVEINGKKTAPKGNSAKSSSGIFNAPGHNYVGLHRSTGIPERRDSVDIDGKTVRIPGKVQRIEPIIRSLTKIMGRRVYFGKIKGKSAEGFYRPSVGEIRTKKKNDVEVLAHEMAHYLDMYTDPKLPSFKKLYKDSKYAEEVKALSYTDDTVKLQEIEGFAEFVRLWLTNSTEAQVRAPNFYKAFGRVLNRHGKLGKQMRTMQEQMHKFYFQGADKLGQALIGDEGTFAGEFNQWVYRRDSRIRQQMIDRFHAARKIEQELTGKISETSASAWKQLRVANGGYEGISDYVLNYGTLNFNEKGDLVKTGESLHDVLAPVKSIDLKEKHKGESKIDLLMRYFAGRRALELHSQNRENLIPKETAKEWARLGKDYPVFEGVFKSYQAFNSRMMDFYQDAGLITPEARKTIQKMNKDYVPFNRIRETLITGKAASGGGFQRLRGGTANLNDILVNMQDGITANIKQALNNKAKARLYQYISGHQDGAIFATKIAPDSKPVKVYLDEMEAKIGKVLEEAGVILDGELDLTSPDLLTFWQHGVKPQLNESGNIVDTVMINGKPKYYEVQDPLLQEMLLAMNPESYSSFMNVMFGIKNFFTRTITLGIEFTGANLVRDTLGATFISKHGFKPFLTSFQGIYSFLKKDKHFQDFMRSGGGYSSRIEASTKEGKARRRVAVDEFGVMSLPEKLLSAFDHFSSAFEYGTRIGEYRLAKKNGTTDMDAAYAAREISTDFGVLGANRFLTGYIRTIPFLNAMVQSQDRVYREALVSKRYDGNPAGMAMKAFMGITLPTLMLYLVNKDDEEYQNIPDHEKRTNWHIKVGEKRFIKIPRPYDVGFVYATMPELYFKYLEDDKGKEFSDGMLWTLTQMYGVDGTPAALSGWWDIVKNEKWTGAPVVPNALSDVEAPQQYNANTSETFVRLGQALDMSPIKAEHAFKAYTGYLGGYLLWGTNKMLWDDERFGPQPESDMSSNVFLRRFITPEVRSSTHAMEKFFDLKEKSDKIVATYKANVDVRRALSGKMDKDGRFKGDNFFGLSGKEKEVLFALNDSMNQLIGVLYGKKGIKTAEIKVRYDKNLTAKEKRKQLDSLWTSRNKAFMQYYNAANEAMMKAKKEADKFKQEKSSGY